MRVMALFMDHIGWHLAFIAASWLLSAVWPWIKQPTWPETPHAHARHGWTILTVAFVASLCWVLLFWLSQGRG